MKFLLFLLFAFNILCSGMELPEENNSYNQSSERSLDLTKEISYDCISCGKTYNSIYEYRAHQVTQHRGLNLRQCPLPSCSKVIEGSMKKHLRTHTGEEPYQCTGCFIKFKQQMQAERHIRSKHHPNKHYYQILDVLKERFIDVTRQEFKCMNCDKFFYEKSQHTRHTKTCKLFKDGKK